MRPGVIGGMMLAVVLAGSAHAGRTPYGWIEDVETVPERGAEVEAWVGDFRNWHLDPTDTIIDATRFGWTATVGVTDRLELRLPLEAGWYQGGGTVVDRWGVDARWRLASADPVEAPAVVPLLRLRLGRISILDAYRVEPGVVVSGDFGRVRVTADFGVAVDVGGDQTLVTYKPGGGVSVAITDELRAGAEYFAELGDHTEINLWSAVGPDLAYTLGRSWLSASALIGLTHTGFTPRLNWGIAF